MPRRRGYKKNYRKKRVYKRRGNKTMLSKQIHSRIQIYRSKRTIAFEVLHSAFGASGTLAIKPVITANTFASPPANWFPIVLRDYTNFSQCFARYKITGVSLRIQTTNQVSVSNDNMSMMVIPLGPPSDVTTWDEGINRRNKLGPMSLGKSNSTSSGRKIYIRPLVADYAWKYSSSVDTQTFRFAKPVWFTCGVPQETIPHYLSQLVFQTIDESPPISGWKMFLNFTVYSQYSMEY